jgi:PLP dependent protein
MTTIANNLQSVRALVERACTTSGRPATQVRLLAVSKTQPAQAVAAAAAGGQTAFGENYVQEGIAKIQALRNMGQPGLEWHLIGPLQSNKTRPVAQCFDWVQSVDRLKIAERLSEQRPAHLPPLQICLQVNIDGGANKSGVAPQDALALAAQVSQLPRLRLRGIMVIPEPASDLIADRGSLVSSKALFDQIKLALYGDAQSAQAHGFDTLSMGMSADLEAAVAHGSTMVRVGTAIFGARPPSKEAASFKRPS